MTRQWRIEVCVCGEMIVEGFEYGHIDHGGSEMVEVVPKIGGGQVAATDESESACPVCGVAQRQHDGLNRRGCLADAAGKRDRYREALEHLCDVIEEAGAVDDFNLAWEGRHKALAVLSDVT